MSCGRVGEVDGPVNGNFLPQHQAHFVGDPRRHLVMRIMRQPQKVAAKVAGMCEAAANIFLAC